MELINKNPIFIHSLFRAGSTFFLSVFQRSKKIKYRCFTEPLHESALFYSKNPSKLDFQNDDKLRKILRHPISSRSYFHELIELWPAWREEIREEYIYDAYFAIDSKDAGCSYWVTLCNASEEQPVFQECRTSNRIGAIKNQIGGCHIFLWRNPWDQWWSYRVANYFDVTSQLIINARSAPYSVKLLIKALDLPNYNKSDIAGAISFYNKNSLTSEHSYMIFYLLWCLAVKEGMLHANVLVNIDRLSDCGEYRGAIAEELNSIGVGGLDFSDCQVPQSFYSEEEFSFFKDMESNIHTLLKEGGWTDGDLEQIHTLRNKFRPKSPSLNFFEKKNNTFIEQAKRARNTVIQLQNSQASIQKEFNELIKQTEERAKQAEERAKQAEERAKQAEERAKILFSSKSWRFTAPLRLLNNFSILRHFK